MKITIIGAAGRMGSWFSRYLSKNGHEVYAYDKVEFTPNNNIHVIRKSELKDVIFNADALMLCVPMHSIYESIRLARYMRPSSLLIEITSIKQGIPKRLRYYSSKYNIRPLSIHPLFGPGADVDALNRYALVPVISAEEEYSTARSIFKGEIITVDEDVHDRTMAYILGMVYIMNVAWLMLTDCKERGLLNELGGSTYRVQSILAESILNDDHSLFASLCMNRYVEYYLERFIDINKSMLEHVKSRDAEYLKSIYSALKDRIGSNDISNSYRLMYKILTSMIDEHQR